MTAIALADAAAGAVAAAGVPAPAACAVAAGNAAGLDVRAANQTRSIPINTMISASPTRIMRSMRRPVRGVIDSRAVDPAFALHALRRQFEHPGEHHRRHEADHEQDHDRARYPGRRIEHRQHRARYLHRQPRGDEIQPGHADDVATLEFFDQRHAVPGYPPGTVYARRPSPRHRRSAAVAAGIPKPPRRWRSASAEALGLLPPLPLAGEDWGGGGAKTERILRLSQLAHLWIQSLTARPSPPLAKHSADELNRDR